MSPRAVASRSSRMFHSTLLASVSAVALLTAGAPARALQLASARGGSASIAAQAAAAAMASVQQAQQATQQSMSSLLRASQAVATMQQAQATARALAQRAPGGVSNGLTPGGLQVAPGAAVDPTLWQNANLPTQSSSNGQTLVTVQQTAQKAILTWSSFNVGQNTTLYFNQSAGNTSTGNSWIALNRVIDPSGVPSQILGQIKAEGSVYVIDANGIVFGGASQVNVNSLIASSLNLFSNDLATSNNRFLTGGIGDLSPANFSTNSILLTTTTPNAGNITIAPGASIAVGNKGLALIAAPNVTNNGSITAPSGQVALVAGIGVSYDYNATSFAPNGVVTQGTNDNNTTNLRFANYGELTDASGDDVTPVGTLTNNGVIYTPTGNITLLGGAIQQNGTAVATTSVQTPGSVIVTSAYEVGTHGALSPADEFDGTFYTGSITFGPNAVTSVLPDTGGVTLASDPTSLAPFQTASGAGATLTTPLPTQGPGLIEIVGRAIDFQGEGAQGGALIYAPGQAISANTVVLPDPRASVPPIPGSGRILLENGAILDVSGIPDTQLAATANFLTVILGGNELADSPLQQADALFGATVTVDMRLSGTNAETGESWVGTPLANLASYLNLEQQSIGQLLVNGGAISLQANEFVGAPGSIINLTGGYLEYLGGMVDPTRLISANGGLYGIGNADPDLTYSIAGQFAVDHTHWGVTQNFSSGLLSGSYYEQAYVQGGNAGTLNINIIGDSGALDANILDTLPDSGAAVVDSTILAQAVAGLRQIAAGSVPNDGAFSFTGLSPIEIGDPSVLSAQSLAATQTPGDFNMSSPLLATADSPYAVANVFSSQILDAADFASITFTAGQKSLPLQAIEVDAGTSLTVQPRGTITLNGDNITIDGTLTAKGGKIAIESTPINSTTGTGTASVPGDILIGSSAKLDVSGFFINDTLSGDQPSALPINAGSISIVANYGNSSGIANAAPPAGSTDLSGNITLATGSVLDLEGGGHVLSNGALALGANGAPLGAGGSLTLETSDFVTPAADGVFLPTRGLITLDGSIDALGMSGGGTLTLTAIALQIGGNSPTAPSDTFYFDPVLWEDRGFGNFVLSSLLGATVPDGAIVNLQHANLLPDIAALLRAPTGSDPALNSSIGYLAGTLASPTNLSVEAGNGLGFLTQLDLSNNYGITLGEGAEINGQAGASVSFSSQVATTILGSITAPGGSISLSAGWPLYLGGNSVLDVSGTIVLNPLEAPVRTADGLQTPVGGTIYAGGTINLSDDASSILVAPGAVLNVSGASGTFVVPQATAGGLLRGGQVVMTSQPEWSNAGQVNINAMTGLLFEGTLVGRGGAPQAAGGTLNLTADPLILSGTDSIIILVPDVAQALDDAGTPFDFATDVPKVQPGSPISAADPQNDILFGVDSLDNSGFANLILNTSGGAGIVGFTGKVSLNLSGSVVFNTAGVVAAEEGNYAWGFNNINLKDGTTDGASLTVTAPYIAWNGPSISDPPITSQPTADAALTFNASAQIDLSSVVYLENIGQATFNSAGDIRLLPSQVISNTPQLFGYLYSAGNMSFNAATIYPVTNTAFVIQGTSSDSTISFGYPDGVGPSAATSLSADGALVVSASNIVQDGDIQVPFGSIILGTGASTIKQVFTGAPVSFASAVPTQSVTLGTGSITSVSANGMVIPFGTTIDQTTWIYNPATANPNWSGASAADLIYTNPLTQAPQGVVTLDGASVQFGTGATVNVAGGGDLQAQEWIPGTGGSRNVLAQFNTSYQNSAAGQQVALYPDARQIYAIDPNLSGAVAAYDPNFGSSGPAVGQSVYLAGGGGLAAGTYTLLPAQYATLPGAYRVVVNSGVINPITNQTVTLADGTLQMSGTLGNNLTGSHASEVAQFYVQPESVWGKYSQYALTSANAFFPAYAATNDLAAPYVPNDAGRLVLEATSSLTLDGTFDGRAGPGGSGGQIDISGQYLNITDNGAGTTLVANGILNFSTPGASAPVLNGTVISFPNAVSGNDVFTVTGTGTLFIPASDNSAVQVISPFGQVTAKGQTISLSAGDTLQTSSQSDTIVVASAGVDTVQLGFNGTLTLPASSATTVTLPDTLSSLTYSVSSSGNGADTITISSPSEFTVGGVNAPLVAGGLYSTTTYSASQPVMATVAGQAITWTTGVSGNATSGAGGTLQFFVSTPSPATLATTLTSGSSTYVLGDLDTIINLSPTDRLTGTFFNGGGVADLPLAAGTYAVTSGQQFGGLSGGAAAATFTANAVDTITYSSGSDTPTLSTGNTYLNLSSRQLDALGAPSLLIGGTRQMTSSGTIITPTANGIIVDNDAADPLAAPQILLVAAPQFQSGTVTLDSEGNTASIMVPVAGTGLVTFQNGSVVEALGPGSAVPTANLILGGTLSNLPVLPTSVDSSNASATGGIVTGYYNDLDAALGTLVQVSNGTPDSMQLPSAAQLAPGSIAVQDNLAGPNATFTINLPSLDGAASATAATIQSGATIVGGNVLTIASTGSAQVQAGATLSGNNIFAIGDGITFVASGVAPTSGLVIDAGVLAGLEHASSLDLQSYGAITFQGDVNIAMTNAGASLTLGAGSLAGTGGDVTISAPTLILDNTLGAPTATAGGSGTLSLDAGTLIFADGAKSVSGFGTVNLVAQQAAIGQGSGSMDFGALPVTLQTPTLIADTASTQSLTTTGALSVQPLGDGTPMASSALGGAITLQGGSVSVGVPIQAQAGNIDLQASNGDITVTGNGELLANGVAKAFGTTIEYAPGGAITLSATNGTVNIQPGALIDFAGATDSSGNPLGGNGGSLSITTTGSAPVALDGTFVGITAPGYSGSNVGLNTGGGVDLDNVAQVLTSAGVTGNISIETGAGDLTLDQSLSASEVSLTADAGMVTINGAIVANGTATATGEISLYGTGGVDVEGSLLATGSPNSPKQGGLINIGTSGIGSTTSLNATYGYENVTTSGTITIGANGMIDAMGGTVTLRAPILEYGSGYATATTSTPITVSAGNQSFIVPGLSLVAGQAIAVVDATTGGAMIGTVTSYDSATGALIVNVTSAYGTGTANTWTIANPSTVNVSIAPSAQIKSPVVLDAYAVWSTADQSTNPNQHFDGIVDPAGWYDSTGTLVSGVFTDINGNTAATWTNAGGVTTLDNQDGTSNSLSYYLSNDYFAPTTYNAAHAVFYGGYDPNTESFNPSSPDAGSLPDFIQAPGFNFGNTFGGIANFTARPEVDLVNPSPSNGGVNGGNISVLTNWNLGAGVLNSDGSITLAYRYQGDIAPVISLRAAGDIRLDATITDGFFQTAPVVLPVTLPRNTNTYDNALAQYDDDVGEFSGSTEISFFDGSSGTLGMIDPNVDLAAPQQGGSTLYYEGYLDYVEDLYGDWDFIPLFFNGSLVPVMPPQSLASEPVAPAASDSTYAADYQTYLAEYDAWLQSNFTSNAVGTPPAPAAPLQPTSYLDYVNEDTNYLDDITNIDFDGSHALYAFAPVAPGFIVAPPPVPPVIPPLATNANLPSNMGSAADPLPVQFASLIGGQSASYQFVAGATLNSANPLALANASNFAAGASLAGEGNVLIDGHTVLNGLNTTNAMIAVPTTIRTGAGSIDIAAAGNFELQDQIAPGVVYTAGTPVSDAPNAGGSTTIAVNTGAFNAQNGAIQGTGVSTILTPEVNPANAGDITLTVQGNIVGFQDVTDTLASGTSAASGLSSNPGAFLGQFWLPWLLTNPSAPNVPWYVNFGSFDQGIMSVGGNVAVRAGGDIRDLAVSLPTTSYLDAADTLHVTGGGNLSVTAGGNIYSGDFYVGQGAGAVQSGGSIAPDFTFESSELAYPVQTLLAVQYGTIAVQARGSVAIGGVYNPTLLWNPAAFGDAGSATDALPVASYNPSTGAGTSLVPYVTSMSPTSGVSIQASGGDVIFNSLLAQEAVFNLGQPVESEPGDFDPDASIESLLLPASLNLVALDGGITIQHGGGLYPSASGTLTIVADQSIALAIPVLSSPVPVFGFGMESQLPGFAPAANISGTALGKLDDPVGTGILPTGVDPALIDATQDTQAQLRDPSLVQDGDSASVLIYSLNGSLIDGEPSQTSLLATVGSAIGQISLIPNAPAQIYAGQDILDLPFYGENFNAGDITSIIAGKNIAYDIDGDGQSPAIELAGPGTLDVIAGGNISFPMQPNGGTTETGIRTLGNSVDADADPDSNRGVPFIGEMKAPLANFGNPYLPNGGASVNVLFGVGPGINYAGFVTNYLNPATAIPFAQNGTWQFINEDGQVYGSPLTTTQYWSLFEALTPAQQEQEVLYDFFAILNATGLDYNNPASATFHQYDPGYQAIETLFPASFGYTDNSLGSTNGAAQLVTTGNFDMRGSTVQTQQGGNISILGPGGRILVGSAVAAPAVDPASQGILTLEQGNIDIFADTDVLVAQSRIMTEQGGNIVMWSSNGNLDAGEGAKTSVSAPPPLFNCDIAWICSVDIKGQVSGAGIATLQSLPGVPVGNANLMAPRGTINAGAAGLRVSGNLNIVALQVLNSFNIQVQGTTVGIPGTTAPNIGALSDASAASGAATKAITANGRDDNNSGQPSILIVEIEGYGGDDGDESATPSPETPKQKPNQIRSRQSYDPSSSIQYVGVGRLTDDEKKKLTPDEQRKLSM